MRLFNWLVICVVVAIFAMLTAGCNTTQEERLATAKKVFTTVAKAAVTIYKAGGKQAAASYIDKQVSEGEIDKDQAELLKTAIDQGVNALENLANDVDSGSTATPAATTEETKTTYSKPTTYSNEKGFAMSKLRRKYLIVNRFGKIFIC
jgi:competence protein ComGC